VNRPGRKRPKSRPDSAPGRRRRRGQRLEHRRGPHPRGAALHPGSTELERNRVAQLERVAERGDRPLVDAHDDGQIPCAPELAAPVEALVLWPAVALDHRVVRRPALARLAEHGLAQIDRHALVPLRRVLGQHPLRGDERIALADEAVVDELDVDARHGSTLDSRRPRAGGDDEQPRGDQREGRDPPGGGGAVVREDGLERPPRG
jgi:hypothetical protein